jgi:lipopolysaccharide biosynthesis glycosyltransferase
MQIDSETITIVTACDENYVQHLGVMLCSLLENTSSKKLLAIHIIDGGIKADSRLQFYSFFEHVYGVKISFLTIDKTRYQDLPISHHFTHTIYYRISIPLLFDESVDKVLYLDSDMVIKDDIKKIWDTDISNYFLGAVEVLGKNTKYADLNMPQESLYFCSGLLLMNLIKWRKNNITEKTIEFISENYHKIQMWDQDSLNSILCDKWLPLPLRWNQLTSFFNHEIYKSFCTREDFLEAIKNPAIIHYTSSYKPWHYGNNHPYKNEYFQYIQLTPWKNFKPNPDFVSLKRMLKQNLLNFFSKSK